MTIDASMLSAGIKIDASGNDPTSNSTYNDGNINNDGDGTNVFTISAFSGFFDVSLKNLTITGGDVFDKGGGISFTSNWNTTTGQSSTLTLENCVVDGNFSGKGGGGIFTSGVLLNVTGSDIKNNASSSDTFGFGGGGVCVIAGPGATFAQTEFTNNEAGKGGGGLYVKYYAQGSPITFQQVATIENCEFLDNEALEEGGGIHADLRGGAAVTPTLNLTNSTVAINTSAIQGGGLAVFTKFGALVNATNSTFSGNVAGTQGGGVWTEIFPFEPDTTMVLNFNQVTLSGNSAEDEGGGIYVGVLNFGGAVGQQLFANLNFVTITKNTSDDGGGVFSEVDSRVKTTFKNTIVSGNTLLDETTANNIAGQINLVASEYNLVGPGLMPTGTGNISNSNNIPGLAALADNGGFLLPDGTRILTHALLPGSPALDAGNPSLPAVSPTPEFDQRGTPFSRIVDGKLPTGARIDIGAYEYNLPPTITEVIIKGTQVGTSTPWDSSVVVSMAARIGLGKQFHSIATAGANTIDIVFSEPITNVDATKFQLKGDNDTLITLSSPTLSQGNTVVTFTFSSLAAGKYALHVKDSAIMDLSGNMLDGDWINDDNDVDPKNAVKVNTPDDLSDDVARTFKVGNGTVGSEYGEFRLHFAYLPGDYDRDGRVSGLDEQMVYEAHPLSDGDGDGNLAESGDIAVWVSNADIDRKRYGIAADFNDDEIVDFQDRTVWQMNYGTTISGYDGYHQADANNSGLVDGVDYFAWMYHNLYKTAWYDPNFDTMVAAATVGLPPQVLNVIISGSMSVHAPFSFDTVDGSGTQLNTVPVAKSDTISIVFSENVNVSAGSLFVVGLTTANLPELADFSYDPLTATATWRFEGWALGDNYLLHLADSVTDTEGNFLDGDWTNPLSTSTTNSLVSTFPSGDGESGGSFVFVMTLLPGDMNLDAVVNNTDYDLYVASLMQGGGTLFVHGDFNGSGTVSGMDTGLFVANWLTDLREIFVLADLNQDGKVDGDDLGILGNNYGMNNADWEDGDLNGDSVVDDLDVDLAFAQYGLTLYTVA